MFESTVTRSTGVSFSEAYGEMWGSHFSHINNEAFHATSVVHKLNNQADSFACVRAANVARTSFWSVL